MTTEARTEPTRVYVRADLMRPAKAQAALAGVTLETWLTSAIEAHIARKRRAKPTPPGPGPAPAVTQARVSADTARRAKAAAALDGVTLVSWLGAAIEAALAPRTS